MEISHGGSSFSERIAGVLLSPWFLAAFVAGLLVIVAGRVIRPHDEALWMYASWLWGEHGLPPYVGSIENKPPGIFLLYRLSLAIFGVNFWPVRLLGIAAMVGAMLVIYRIGQHYLDRTAAVVAAALFGMMMANPFNDGCYPATTESFLVLFTASAFYCFSQVHRDPQNNKRWLWMLGVGAALGGALAFKQIVVCDVVGLIPMYWVATREKTSFRAFFLDAFLVASVAVCTIGLSLLPFLASGATVQDYWKWTWAVLFPQTSHCTSDLSVRWLCQFLFDPRRAAILPFFVLFVAQRKRLHEAGVPYWSLLFWLSVSLAGACMGSRYWHQFKIPAVPFAIMAGLGVSTFLQPLTKNTLKPLLLTCLSIILVLFPESDFDCGYHQLFRHKTLQCNLDQAANDRNMRAVAEYVKTHSEPSDPIYVSWHSFDGVPVYFYAGRPSSCRFFTDFFFFVSEYETTVAEDLAKKPPKLIVLQDVNIWRPAQCVLDVVAEGYSPVATFDSVQIFQRNDASVATARTESSKPLQR